MIDFFFHLTFSPEGTYRVFRSHRIPCAEIAREQIMVCMMLEKGSSHARSYCR